MNRQVKISKLSIKFQHIEPHSHLKNYIEKMWIFQIGGRMPIDDYFSREHQITLTGLIDVPVILDTENDIETETIGIEFNPQGVYRFFHFNLNEIKSRTNCKHNFCSTKINCYSKILAQSTFYTFRRRNF
jgi:hypothetical protein